MGLFLACCATMEKQMSLYLTRIIVRNTFLSNKYFLSFITVYWTRTFAPSLPAAPGRPCSPGGPGGPGWPLSPTGPVSPVGP